MVTDSDRDELDVKLMLARADKDSVHELELDELVLGVCIADKVGLVVIVLVAVWLALCEPERLLLTDGGAVTL